jgi:hypothetical protein
MMVVARPHSSRGKARYAIERGRENAPSANTLYYPCGDEELLGRRQHAQR